MDISIFLAPLILNIYILIQKKGEKHSFSLQVEVRNLMPSDSGSDYNLGPTFDRVDIKKMTPFQVVVALFCGDNCQLIGKPIIALIWQKNQN